MIKHYLQPFDPAARHRHLSLEDFEEAGVRVMIVSTREAVSKAMSEFQRDDLIEVRDRKIAISPRLSKIRLSEPSSSPGAAA
jgi:hypothetical protein